MKICLINNLYAPFARGGAERIVEDLSNGLNRRGYESFVITSRPYDSKPEGLSGQKIYYLPSLYYNLSKIPYFLRYFWHLYDNFDLANYYRLKRILKKEKPDVVITNNLKGLGMLATIAIRRTCKRHIHILHDIQLLHPSGLMIYGQEHILGSFFAGIYQKINRNYFKKTDAVVSPSEWLLNLHAKSGFFDKAAKKIIRNPMPMIGSDTAEKEFDESRNDILRFLYVGQLEEHKGIKLLLGAYQTIMQSHPGKSFLTIIGDGKLRPFVEEACCNTESLAYLGKKDRAEVLREMSGSDLLIVPSVCYENSPTVMHEAASVGLSMLASRLGGMAELALELGAMVFEPASQADLEKKLTEIIIDSAMIAKLKKTDKLDLKRFSIERYLERLIELF